MKESGSNTQYCSRLSNFPISFLAVALGLVGLTLAWQKAEQIFHLPFTVSNYLLYFSIVVFIVISLFYSLKIIKYPKAAKKEFEHPVKLNFYPLLAKILLILSIIYLSLDMEISRTLWWAGVIIQFGFTIVILSSWIEHDKFEITHLSPAWFIPVVGCMIIPIAGVSHFNSELSWFFLSIGVFWWILLSTIIMNRIIFHHPLPDKLVPTFFILFAPPVIGFIALTKLMGTATVFGNILYYIGLFLFVLIIFQHKLFAKIKFYLSWWAYSFPVAALSIGTLLMYHESGLSFFSIIFWIIFIFLNAVILLLAMKTIIAILGRKICIE